MSVREAVHNLLETAIDASSQLIEHTIERIDTRLQLALEAVVDETRRRRERLDLKQQLQKEMSLRLVQLFELYLGQVIKQSTEVPPAAGSSAEIN